ncbi:MAG: serine hydrolase [Thermoplasmatales archaeon]|nr:serine hydrolase [Thermoplasmatales archaeon]
MVKMKNYNVFKKGVVLLIILVFLGTNIVTVNAEINNKNTQFFDLKMKLLMHLANLPSFSACIIKNDTVVWNNGYGFYNRCILVGPLRWKKPTNSTQYLIGSISKTITATVMMQIIENESYGVDLDDDVNDYLDFNLRNPNYPDIPITFEMLLSHRSSLIQDEYALHGDAPMELSKMLKAIFKAFTVINSKGDVLKIVLDNESSLYEPKLWYNYPPGENGNYSNLGFIVLGYLIERITGQTYEDYVQRNIFDPLGMNNTTVHPDKKNEMAVPTLKIAGLFIPLPHYDFCFATPAGNIRSTTDDLSKFLIVHMNNGSYKDVKILEKETVEDMHTPRGMLFGIVQYGLGWIKIGQTEGHSGGTPGGGAHMYYRELDKTGVVVFWNQLRVSDTSEFRSKMRGKIVKLLFEKSKEF